MPRSKKFEALNKRVMREVGQKLQRLRKRQGFSQVQISKYLDISDETLSNYETGKVSIPLDILLLLSSHYGISKIHFYPSTKWEDFDAFFDIPGRIAIEQHLKSYDDSGHTIFVNASIYKYISIMLEYESDPICKGILKLFLDYCGTLKLSDGSKVCEDAIIWVNTQKCTFVDAPQILPDYTSLLTVDVET